MIHRSEAYGSGGAQAEALDFGISIALAYAAFVEELREDLSRAGYDDLHASFGYVARALDRAPMTLRELADHLGVTSQGALKIVDEMEAGGYLERAPDPADGRAKRLALTERGNAALAQARGFHRRFERNLGRRLGKTALAETRRVLEEMVKSRADVGKAPVLRPM
jgi:DNA-binding MarR family transcriptional regulator